MTVQIADVFILVGVFVIGFLLGSIAEIRIK